MDKIDIKSLILGMFYTFRLPSDPDDKTVFQRIANELFDDIDCDESTNLLECLLDMCEGSEKELITRFLEPMLVTFISSCLYEFALEFLLGLNILQKKHLDVVTLHSAIRCDVSPCLMERLVTKTNINEKAGRNARTAVFIAAKRHNWPVVKLLVEHGADVAIRDAKGKIPLFVTGIKEARQVRCLDKEVLEMLVNKDNVNVKDKYSWSVLRAAVNKAELQVVQFLVEVGADLEEDNGEHCPLLHALRWMDVDIEIIKLLLTKNNVNAKHPHGVTPLIVAFICCRWKLVRLFIWSGANVELLESIFPRQKLKDPEYVIKHVVVPGKGVLAKLSREHMQNFKSGFFLGGKRVLDSDSDDSDDGSDIDKDNVSDGSSSPRKDESNNSVGDHDNCGNDKNGIHKTSENYDDKDNRDACDSSTNVHGKKRIRKRRAVNRICELLQTQEKLSSECDADSVIPHKKPYKKRSNSDRSDARNTIANHVNTIDNDAHDFTAEDISSDRHTNGGLNTKPIEHGGGKNDHSDVKDNDHSNAKNNNCCGGDRDGKCKCYDGCSHAKVSDIRVVGDKENEGKGRKLSSSEDEDVNPSYQPNDVEEFKGYKLMQCDKTRQVLFETLQEYQVLPDYSSDDSIYDDM